MWLFSFFIGPWTRKQAVPATKVRFRGRICHTSVYLVNNSAALCLNSSKSVQFKLQSCTCNIIVNCRKNTIPNLTYKLSVFGAIFCCILKQPLSFASAREIAVIMKLWTVLFSLLVLKIAVTWSAWLFLRGRCADTWFDRCVDILVLIAAVSRIGAPFCR